MRIVKQKQGQFIIIAALLIAIMMVSASTIMYSAVTYYRHERWEEYLAIIDNVELGSRRVVEISLADYTWNNCTDDTILRDNLNQWVNDTKKAYAGFGVNLTYYDPALTHYYAGQYENESFSKASTTFNIDIISVGLKGYNFTASAFLRMKIFDFVWDNSTGELTVSLAVDREGSIPVNDLKKDSFSIRAVNASDWNEIEDFTLVHYYNETCDSGRFIYEIHCSIDDVEEPTIVSLTAVDSRSIKVTANLALTEEED